MMFWKSERGHTELTAEGKAVLSAFEKFQRAMIDKDMDTLYAMVTPDKTFTHMSGKTQTKEEYFGEIADGTLNYFKYEIRNPAVKINGDFACLTSDTTLTAKVYGMSGSWTLRTEAWFQNIGGAWIYCNAPK
ncbi:MAG: nuclear transport factor 2 family protein [Abditibacteriota bacterium]|nr:nuclear transport factor 2 family protein [Abditibacteriota bacterium]